MIITVDFRLFWKKMLVFFQKLIPAEWLLTLFITELNQDLPLLEKKDQDGMGNYIPSRFG